MTKESAFYWNEVLRACATASRQFKLRVRCLDAPIYDRAALKRAVTTGGIPVKYVGDFRSLWQQVTEFLDDH